MHRSRKKTNDCFAVSGLELCDLNCENIFSLPPVYTQPSLPVSRKDIKSYEEVRKWPNLCDVPINRIEGDVGILIGINVP